MKKQLGFMPLILLVCLVMVTIGSVSAATHYVSLDSPVPQPPYCSWATAAMNIQDAVDAAVAGDEIVVTNGVYANGGQAVDGRMTNRVAVTKPLTLRSVNGPEFTIIQGAKAPGGGNGDGAIRCVYLAGGAHLSGFTLTNGATRIEGDQERERHGGGVWCVSTYAVVSNCVLTGNSAGFGGGSCGGTLYNCTVTNNSVSGGGGGIYNSTLYDCTLTGNSASWQGGGSCDGTLYNCVVTGNSAFAGGGASASKLYNCTLTGNSADEGGGVFGGAITKLYNCIVCFNHAPNGANYAEWTTIEYSCTTPLPPGSGNIASDPQLATLSHLSSSSPCIGAGNPAYAKGMDIDGELWANPPAMGADQTGTAADPLSLWIDATFTNVTTRYPVSFMAGNTGPILKSVWDFGDGIRLTNQAFTSHAWNVPGVYAVRLTGYNNGYPDGVTATVQVTVSEPVSYVDAASTHPVFPYETWATAAKTIQDAIPAGTLPGRRVLVTNGVYRVGTVETNGLNRVALTNAVVVQSVNGPAVTVIEGETNGVRCAYVGKGSVLSGFTLTKGTASPGGVYCESFGVVTNCVLTGNAHGGAYGGTLYHCVLTGNSAFEGNGGGAARATLYDCTLSNNSVTGVLETGSGGGAFECTLDHCILTGNTAASGGGATDSSLYNCILTGNSAYYGGGFGGGHNRGTLCNCVLTGNSADWDGGGVGGGTIFNCIVYFNHAPWGANYAVNPGSVNYAGKATFEYSCTTPLPPGPGNIAVDPRFMNATTGDFRLRPDSPCIDAGTNLTDLLATDLRRYSRVMDGNGDGLARVDMGAYEFSPYRFSPILELDQDGLAFTVQGSWAPPCASKAAATSSTGKRRRH